MTQGEQQTLITIFKLFREDGDYRKAWEMFCKFAGRHDHPPMPKFDQATLDRQHDLAQRWGD